MMKSQKNRDDAAGTARRHWGRIISAVFFLLLVFSNALLTLLGVNILKEFHENRNLAPKPMSKNGKFLLSRFISEFDAYISDHFCLRKPLLISQNTVKYFLFNVSPDPKAMPSKKGWIFYGTSLTLRDYARVNQLEPLYVERIEQSLRERKAWLNARGIGFIFTITPNKHNIYPQYMPSYRLKGKGISNGEWLGERLAKALPGTVANMFPALRRAAKHRQAYYKIDTHWNHWGAKEAALAVFHLVKKSFPGIKIKPLPGLKDTPEVLFPGNFGQVMGVPLREEEQVPVPLEGWSWKNVSASELKDMLPERAGVFQRVNPKAPPTRVLVLGDSFMSRFDKYISEMFGHSIFVNLWDTPLTAANRFPIDFIATLKPDIVIFLIAERRLQYSHYKNNGYFYSAENPGEVCKAVK